MARAKGLHVITGEEMFVQQGARQFEIWTGKPAPVTEMHSVVRLAVYGVAATQPISPVPLKSVIPIKPAAPAPAKTATMQKPSAAAPAIARKKSSSAARK